MANSKLKRFFYFSVFLILILFSLYLINAISAHIFTGKVIIGSNTSTTGAFVAAYINGVMRANCTVGIDCGFGLPSYSYYLTIPGNDGDALVFTIYNVTANDTYTFASNTVTPLNLTITQLSNDAVCKWSEACLGGYCCLRSTEYHGTGIGTCQARACTVKPLTVYPANATYSAGMTINFNVSLDDPGNCSISIDGASNVTMTRINSTWFDYSNTFSSVGAHQVKYSCNDSGNDFNYTSTRWFSIDASSPNISISAPANNSNFTGAAENITISIEDANKNYTGMFAALKNSTAYYKLDGTRLTAATYEQWTNLKRSGSTSSFNSTLNSNNFADGSYLLYVNASDNTTNLAQNKSINITIDNTNPTLSISAPANNTNQTDANVNITAQVTDTNRNNTGVFAALKNSTGYYKLDGTKLTAATYEQWTNLKRSGSTDFFNATLNANNFADGSYLLYVNASDILENVGIAANLNITIDNTAPSVTLSSPANATSTTTAAQTFVCNTTDGLYLLNVSLYIYDSSNSSRVHLNTSNITGTSDSTSFTYTLPYDATFLWNCKAADLIENVAWATSNRSITKTTVAAPVTEAGGGGAGGVVTPEGVSQTKYSGLIAAGASKEITYTKEELKVTSIEIKTAEQVANAGIKVAESTASKAGIAISAGEGGTYKYLEITKSLIEDKQIASVKINFKVEKSWYDANGYDITSTTMRRKVGDAWQDLPTTKYKEDDNYYYFYAESTGLSYFAITAKKIGVVVPPVEKKAVCGDNVCEYNETCSNCIADCACKADEECVDAVCKEKAIVPAEKLKISRAKLILIGAGILILAIIIIALIVKPKKRKFNP